MGSESTQIIIMQTSNLGVSLSALIDVRADHQGEHAHVPGGRLGHRALR